MFEKVIHDFTVIKRQPVNFAKCSTDNTLSTRGSIFAFTQAGGVS